MIDESGDTLPEAEKFLRCLNGSEPCDEDPQGNKQPGVLESLYPYLEELNPILDLPQLLPGTGRARSSRTASARCTARSRR